MSVFKMFNKATYKLNSNISLSIIVKKKDINNILIIIIMYIPISYKI